jgi:phosphatidate cytidylyltransferase
MTSGSKKFSSLGQRVPAALFGAIIILGSLYQGQWTYFAIFLVISIITQWEFYKLAKLDDKFPLKTWGTIIGQSFFLLSFLIEAHLLPLKYFLLVFPMLAGVFMIKLYKKNDEKPFTNVAYTFLGIIYVAIPFSLLNVLAFANDVYSYEIIMGMILIIWASDTGAYFAGITLGKKKLFERVSPKKTWEGSLGGGVVALLMATLLARYFHDLTLIQWYFATFIIVIAGIYGDLVESLFKRGIEIKDSGSLIPGHGGFLDRFDSLLLAVPFIVVFIKIF